MSAQYDVIVVGCGPVGLAAAAFLGSDGHRVLVLERYTGLYQLPRAATFDDETMRSFDRLGIADDLLPLVRFQPVYEWRNAEGDLLHQLHYEPQGPSGWAEWYQMHQPDVEAALHRRCEDTGNVEFRFETEVIGYDQQDALVEVRTAQGAFTASYVIGADGGNGMTRGAIGAALDDYGFSEPWLVCDFKLEPGVDVPKALQIGDPIQPTSIISLGPTFQRFSFMLDSPEDFEIERDPQRVWNRVREYLSEDQAELIRVATYTFRSLLCDRWRDRRIFLVGDAAHQMPPFLGQGMVSGIRDARNIAFKLGLVLTGRAPEGILDTYQPERFPHVESITRHAMELGRNHTIRDPLLAAERDRRLLSARKAGTTAEKLRFPALSAGLLSATPSSVRGYPMPQARVEHGGETLLMDRVFPKAGFTVIAFGSVGSARESVEQSREIDQLIEIGGDDLADVDGGYETWFRENGVTAVLVRPDDYIFGGVEHMEQLPGLIDELHRRLTEA